MKFQVGDLVSALCTIRDGEVIAKPGDLGRVIDLRAYCLLTVYWSSERVYDCTPDEIELARSDAMFPHATMKGARA